MINLNSGALPPLAPEGLENTSLGRIEAVAVGIRKIVAICWCVQELCLSYEVIIGLGCSYADEQ